ncbi:MAG TPA: hypothetical protein VKA27_02850, partial [Sunxiuqinia sp.]|nr:hypothetical protein [Sunxiuqinia sp.]
DKQKRWDLVVINPGFILGPSLSKRADSTSIDLMIQLYSGKFRTGVPAGDQAIIDVRDAAKAHILAGLTPTAKGRHITAAHHSDLLKLTDPVREKYPDYSLPKSHAPKWLMKLLGPFLGFSRKYVERNVGYDIVVDNSYIKKDLGIDFIPLKQTVTDHFEQLVNDNLIPDKRA